MKKYIAPSILSADFGNLEAEVKMLNESEADLIHCDIMDGSFVPNLSFGIPVLKAIHRSAGKPLDVHLMIVDPDRYIDAFRDAGADILTVHQEACIHLDRTLSAIRQAGMRAGVAINPATPVESLTDCLHLADLVCVMSVNPGFGGQKFIENTYNKVMRLRSMREKARAELLIEIDGGVNGDNAGLLIDAGADVLVAGSYVFGADDPVGTIADLKYKTVRPVIK